MTISQAFTQWAVAPRNTVLAAKSRDAVRRVLMKQWGDIDLKQFSETFARRIFRESREPLEMQVKAASILVYVLQWGGDHGHCRRPKFTYEIASEEYHKAHEQPAAAKPRRQPMPPTLAELQDKTHLPAAAQRAAAPQQPSPAEPPSTTTPKNKSDMKQTKSPAASGEAPEISNLQPKRPRQKGHRGQAPRPVTQIDPQTLQPLQQFPTIREAAETVGCLASNIHRAVSQLRSAGGYYWCDPENAPQFAHLMDQKKTSAAVRRAIAATINKGRRKQVGDAKAEKDQQPAALAAFTDRDLCDELRRRGWSITLTMAAD